MSSTKEQVLNFLEKCDELKNCKFIMATTKIKDMLKCIVNSPELYKLFDTVTKDFNYTEQKAICLVTDGEDILRRSYVVLPKTVGQRLAFIFCLLVEFDRDTLNFNDFLQLYFHEDGSYYASYRAFCRTVISSLEDLIKQVFKEQLNSPEEVRATIGLPAKDVKRSNLVSSIIIAVEEEKLFLSGVPIANDEKENAIKMLNALIGAVRAKDEQLIDALICGYNYFVLYYRCVSEGISSLIENIAEYEETI